jgi:hypothetical protein
MGKTHIKGAKIKAKRLSEEQIFGVSREGEEISDQFKGPEKSCAFLKRNKIINCTTEVFSCL